VFRVVPRVRDLAVLEIGQHVWCLLLCVGRYVWVVSWLHILGEVAEVPSEKDDV
jgi:hypothetical protein